MSFVGYKITKNILYNLWLYRKIAFRWLTFMIFCTNDVLVSLFLCSKWDVDTILIRVLSRTPLFHLSRERMKTAPYTLFEYDIVLSIVSRLIYHLVIWLSFVWSFGNVLLGDLEQIHSAICGIEA